jgi:hypothetical protein
MMKLFPIAIFVALGSLSLSASEFSGIKLWIIDNLVRLLREAGSVLT